MQFDGAFPNSMQVDGAFHASFDVFPTSNDDPAQQEQEQQERPAPRPRREAPTEPPLGPDNTNRPHVDLPPVVNGRLQYANKQLKYRPFPSDVDEIREKLFKLEQPVLLDSQQITDYWTHMSNVYMRSTKPSLELNGTVIETWECRNRRRVTIKDKPRPNLGMRNRPTKVDTLEDMPACKVRVKLTTYTKHAKDCLGVGLFSCKCIPEWMYIDLTGQNKSNDFKHTHDISVCDSFKRSNALMYACKVKVEERYKYQAVGKWVREKYGPVAKEVAFLTKQDISNVSKYWRMINKDVELRAEVEQDDPQVTQRGECMDAIQVTPADQLRKALIEVCSQIPPTVDMIRPFLATPTGDAEEQSAILEGEDLVVPPPGLPTRKYRPDVTPNVYPNGPQAPPIQAPSASPQNGMPHHPPMPPNLQLNDQPVPPSIHPLHVPAHLVGRYLYSQSQPPQMLPSGEPAPRTTSGSPVTPFSGHGFSTPPQNGRPHPNATQQPPPRAFASEMPPPTSVIHLLRHGSTPDVRPPMKPPTNGVRYDRPSWAVPQKRGAEPAPNESSTPSKRPNTNDDIVSQLERELQS